MAMMRNSANDFGSRLFNRVPAIYRYYDGELQGALKALLGVIGGEAAVLHQDILALWDDFFVETCADWAVPYIGALVGAEPLPEADPQSERLNVRNTTRWRRSKGSLAMVGEVANQISNWPVELVEALQTLAVSQSVNAVRLGQQLTPDLRDPYRVSLFGTGHDSFSRSIDVKTSAGTRGPELSPAYRHRHTPRDLPGRYPFNSLAVLARRLRTFALWTVTPAPASIEPERHFTFDPLGEDIPLVIRETGAPLTRAAFDQAPWQTFGTDLAVRQTGVLLACADQPRAADTEASLPLAWSWQNGMLAPVLPDSVQAFTFGDATDERGLDPVGGLSLVNVEDFARGGGHFVITALWAVEAGGEAEQALGQLSTLLAARLDPAAFHAGPGRIRPDGGRLVIQVETGRPGPGWPNLQPSAATAFPGAVLTVCAAPRGARQVQDALYVYLPASTVSPDKTLTYHVASDGSTYSDAELTPASLARSAEGQVFPPRDITPSGVPATQFTALSELVGLVLVDRSRFGPDQARAAVQITASLIQADGTEPGLGSLATVAVTGIPAFQYRPPPNNPVVGPQWPEKAALAIRLEALGGSAVPSSELIVASWDGYFLLVYLPELPAGAHMDLVVSDDGSTYCRPDGPVPQHSYGGLQLARASAGQVLPISGVWPLRQRLPVARDLSNWANYGPLSVGQLGVDPERGRFALPADDPAIADANFSVDYVEAFSDRIGARTARRPLDWRPPATRYVLHEATVADRQPPLQGSPTLDTPVHATLADALAHAESNDVIEFWDSATYEIERALEIPDGVEILTIQAGYEERPLLRFTAPVGLRVGPHVTRLNLNGLLMSGGSIQIEAGSGPAVVRLAACSLVPPAAIVAGDVATGPGVTLELYSSIIGPIRLGSGVHHVIAQDCILGHFGGQALAGLTERPDPEARPGPRLGLDRVTVLGQVWCDAMEASNCLFQDLVEVEDRQAGCVRFSRYQPGSILPYRYRCLPADAKSNDDSRGFAPLFTSLRFGQPAYGQLNRGGPPELLTANEHGGEVGAFADALMTVRLRNLEAKLTEFVPAGLSSLVIPVS